MYRRKSSDSEVRQILSLDSQKRELMEFAKKEGLKIVGDFQESQSAYKQGREEFAKVVEMIRTKKADGVLVYHISRLARNMTDGGIIIDMLKDEVLQESADTIGNLCQEFRPGVLFSFTVCHVKKVIG